MTKKEYEFVEDSEEENTDADKRDGFSKSESSPEKSNEQVVQTKKNSPQEPSTKKANKPQLSAKMKQSNIMSFFTKKWKVQFSC